MKRRFTYLLIALTVVALGAQSCVPKDDSITIKVGVALGNDKNSWNVAAGKYAGVQFASHRLPYMLGSSINDSLQCVLLRRMVTTECHAVLLMPDPELTVDSLVDIFGGTGIPIFFFEEALAYDHVLLVKGDNVAAGRIAAEFVTKTLNGAAPEILILKAPGYAYDIRIEAFRTAVSGGNVTEVEVEAATVAAGVAAIEKWLADDAPAAYNAIYTADDDLAVGVIQALAADGVTARPAAVAGCGGSQAFVKLIAGVIDEPTTTTEGVEPDPPLTIPAGIEAGTVFYPPTFIQEAAETIAQLVLNSQAPGTIEIEGPTPEPIHPGNALEYIDPQSLY